MARHHIPDHLLLRSTAVRNPIPDYLLKTSVGIKVESGVSAQRIRALINEFAAEQPEQELDGGFSGFLSIEDIPQARRESFLWVLDSLCPVPTGAQL